MCIRDRQTSRMNAMELLNQQSLAKITELQSAPVKRASTGTKSKSVSKSKLAKAGEELSDINGIGPTYQKKLHKLGVKTIREIGNWSADDVKKYADKLGCGEAVTQDWKEKAKAMGRK